MVPCDAGCDGPIWSAITSDVGSASTTRSGVTAPGARAALISILRSRSSVFFAHAHQYSSLTLISILRSRSSVFFAHAHQYSSLTLISILRSRSCPRGPRPLERIALGHQRLAAHEGVVLAQRVALELRVHEDAPQVGVPGETDAEHVPRLALGPERGLPGRRDGGDGRNRFRDRRLHAEAVVPAERVELVDHLEARRAPQVVDDGQIREHVEARLGMVAARRARP